MSYKIIGLLLFLLLNVISIKSIKNNNLLLVNSNKQCNDKLKQLLKVKGGSSDKEISALDWRYFLAGGICAATSHGITTPIDVIKTRIQTNPEKYTQGVFHAAKDIIATEGVSFLLAGLAPTIVGYGIEGALKFGFYETFKILFLNLTPSSFVNLLLASVVAGAVASIVLCPMEETRIKMVGDKTWTNENLISGIARLVKENGIFNTFSGLPAMLSKQIPYTMGKQVSFDIAAAYLYILAASLAVSKVDAKWPISILSAFVASIFACIFSQPGDMILTATYRSEGSSSFLSTIANIYKQRGLAGFFLGLQARLAHVASIITSQLVLYDIIKISLGLPVTGSH